MSRILSVYIEKNGKQEYVGKIVGDSSVDACFSYDDSYIEKNGKPISISLPLEEKAFDEKRTRYFFEGLLPEGFTRKCVADWMQKDVNDYLSILAGLGNECLGAIQILDENSGKIVPDYRKLTEREVEILAKEGASESAEIVTKSHLSLTGASGKVGLYYDKANSQWYLPLGSMPSTHIVKQSHVRLEKIVVNEQLCLLTASNLGIKVPNSFIINSQKMQGENILFATERYDRKFKKENYMLKDLQIPFRFIDMILNDSLIKELESYRQPYIGKEKNTQNYAEKVYRTYTCSFSTNKDSLTMWNYYATSGSGVNLIFDFAWNLFEGSDISEVNNSSHLENDITICRGLVLYQRMDKQKCIKALLDNLYEVYLQEDTIEKCQSHIQWAFKEAINNMRCFFKNDSFSCENEYRVILKIPEELLLEETTGQDGILKKGQFKRGNILIPYVDYKFKRDSLKEITLNPYVKEKESVFELGIRELLWQNKIHNVQIYRSAIPMRKYF